MRIFLMNDDYGTVVAAKDEEQAQKYFKSTFDFEVDDDYCSVKREINPRKLGIFEDAGQCNGDGECHKYEVTAGKSRQ